MNNHMRQELDRYITGNYGADELTEDNPILGTIFTLGVVARQKGDSLDTCPYTEPNFKQAWVSGWTDQDMVEHEFEQE